MESLVPRLPQIVIQLLAFALAISVHESAHGWVAERLGDPTARWLGRITLNPIKHVDLVGTIIFPLVLALLGAPIIGWAKPVPFVSRNLRNQRRDPALVGLAGPAANILLGAGVVLVLLLLKAVMPSFREVLDAMIAAGALGASGIAAPLIYLLFSLAMINLVLAVFNLIPIPPLDGSHVVGALLPPRLHWQWVQLERYGFLMLFALLWTGIFGVIFKPFVNALLWILFS
jgi:Zn-dependent protease